MPVRRTVIMPARKVRFDSFSSSSSSSSTSTSSSGASTPCPSLSPRIVSPKRRDYRFDEAMAAKQGIASLHPPKKATEMNETQHHLHLNGVPLPTDTVEPDNRLHHLQLIRTAFQHASHAQTEAETAVRDLAATEKEIESARAGHRGVIVSSLNGYTPTLSQDYFNEYDVPVSGSVFKAFAQFHLLDAEFQYQYPASRAWAWADGWTLLELDEAGELARRLANRKIAIAQGRHASARAFAARLGHPFAVEEGGWTIFGLEEQQEEDLLTCLDRLCHTEKALLHAGYQMDLTRAPAAVPNMFKRKVIALDCEFVGVGPLDRDTLAQLCAIDVLTGQVLLDVLVSPDEEITSYRTQYSGLTEQTYRAYRAQNLLLRDASAAREVLFNFIDESTILIGFALHNDLLKLNFSHSRIIDPQILTREAVESRFGREVKRRWKLRDLCRVLLNREVQGSVLGHDCLEDCFAPRELVVWLLNQKNRGVFERWVEEQARDRYNYWNGNFLECLEWDEA